VSTDLLDALNGSSQHIAQESLDPVTAKFRVFSTVEKTVEYAKMLERAGAQILTAMGVHEQRGQLSAHNPTTACSSFHSS
jgi:hypothetical protein